MRVSYSPGYYAPLPERHVFPMGKFEALRDYLVRHHIIKETDIIEPSPAERADLLLVHTPEYVDTFLGSTPAQKAIKTLGLPWSERLAMRVRLLVQGTINAAIMAVHDGIAGNLDGGTHHAMPGSAEGFCVFNDVAVAIRVLQRSKWIQKALIVDCDVHQGNGNAVIFAGDSSVYTFSLHAEHNYPFKKPPSDLDIGLPDGTGDEVYNNIFGEALGHVFSEFTPDIVFYIGGADPLKSDKLGRLALSVNGIKARDTMLIDKVRAQGIPLVLVIGGGYSSSLAELTEAHAQMFIAAKNYSAAEGGAKYK